MPKHDEPRPPRVRSFADLHLLSAMLPGTFPDNLVGQKVVVQTKQTKHQGE